jgi:Catalase
MKWIVQGSFQTVVAVGLAVLLCNGSICAIATSVSDNTLAVKQYTDEYVHLLVPCYLQIGRLVLNRNPTNYFAEVSAHAYYARALRVSNSAHRTKPS